MAENTSEPAHQAGRSHWTLLGIAVCLAALAAALVVPVRLARWPVAPYYAVGYLADEYAKIERIDIPPDGASPSNVYNHFGESKGYSPLLVDSACQSFLRLTGMNIFAFFWLWRALFPVALLTALFWFMRTALGRRRRVYGSALHVVAAGCGLALLYLLTHLLVDRLYDYSNGYTPIFLFLNRIPSNLEFILSLVVLTLYLRFLARPVMREGIVLALAGAATVYLRPYAALPWGIAIALGMAWLLCRRQLPPRVGLTMLALFVIALVPLGAISAWNATSPAYRDQMRRIFEMPEGAYCIHAHWKLFLALAATLAVLSRLVRGPARVLVVTGSLALAVLPWICGLTPVAKELLLGDRFGCFHTVLLIAGCVLALESRAASWSGRAGLFRARRWTGALGGLGLAAAIATAAFSCSFPLGGKVHVYHPHFLTRDQLSFRTYSWIQQNTPKDSVFLVDDGYDWSQVSPAHEFDLMLPFWFSHRDLFHSLARRQRVFCHDMWQQALTDEDCKSLQRLHAATFGFCCERSTYLSLLQKYHPTHVLWRKYPPVFEDPHSVAVPRSENGRLLQSCSQRVYADLYTEVREIDYQRLREITAAGQ
ncbi:MAG TPA: hypothetical protein VGP72_06330 [Planctomycetota bacterium]|jgi:hypothetical protein